MCLAIGFTIGVWVVNFYYNSLFTASDWLAVALLILLVGLLTRTRFAILIILVAGLMLGAFRGSMEIEKLIVVNDLNNKIVSLVGTIDDTPQLDASSSQQFNLKEVTLDDIKIDKNIQIQTFSRLEFSVGDRVMVQGKLLQGSNGRTLTMRFAKVLEIEKSQNTDALSGIKDQFIDNTINYIGEPAASLGLGLVLGQKSGLPADSLEYLRIAGLSHIIVASGYNLTILVRFGRRIFAPISKYLAVVSGFVMIIGFMSVTQAGPSILRAGIVAGLALIAWQYGRRFHPVALLFYAAALTLVINPSYAWGDLGWVLSFLAFIGVMVVAPILGAYFFGDKKPNAIRQIGIETMSAFIVTAPAIALVFSTISNVAIITNMLVLPIVPIVMLGVFLTGLFGFVSPPLAELFGKISELLLNYQLGVSEYFASLSWAQLNITISLLAVIIFYIVLAGIILYMKKVTGYDLRKSSVIE